MSLHLLAARFGNLVGEQLPPVAELVPPQPDFPSDLTRIRDEVNHHIIPLLLLARSDGESVPAEQQVILAYCLKVLSSIGMAPTSAQRAAVEAYLRDFKPSRAQLTHAVHRLEGESKTRIAALIAAARAVVDADGERRPYELKILAELARDLSAL